MQDALSQCACAAVHGKIDIAARLWCRRIERWQRKGNLMPHPSCVRARSFSHTDCCEIFVFRSTAAPPRHFLQHRKNRRRLLAVSEETMPTTERTQDWRADVADEETSRSAIRKVVWRLVPIFLLCNFANYLDRTNVSFAALTMNRDMGFDATTFGIGAGIFSLGYFVFQIPSSIMSEKMGARFWISIMMMTWGIISALNGLIWDETSFLAVRFLLGAAEAGFAPAMIVYLTWWVPKPQRARMLALSGTASILSALIGSPLSGWVLETFHMVHGLVGWRWLFFIESIPALIMALAVALTLKSRPDQATWLTEPERQWLTRTIAAERAASEAGGRYSLGQAVAHPRVLALALTYFFMILSLAGTGMWMPLMLKQ
ncbi:MAG TPA: MFS transporter, partial [Reyranella sp.]|nr:MFS transporter [Reyranella sp.]